MTEEDDSQITEKAHRSHGFFLLQIVCFSHADLADFADFFNHELHEWHELSHADCADHADFVILTTDCTDDTDDINENHNENDNENKKITPDLWWSERTLDEERRGGAVKPLSMWGGVWGGEKFLLLRCLFENTMKSMIFLFASISFWKEIVEYEFYFLWMAIIE